MRTIIIDDEPKNNRILSTLLKDYCTDINIIGVAKSVEEAYLLIVELKPDLIFLDIEMSGSNGFDLLDKLMPIEFSVIFITAFENYSIKAFKYSALDYLLKPVNIEELQQAVEKAKKTISQNDVNLKLTNYIENKKNAATINKIALQTDDGLEFISLEIIVRVLSKSNYSLVYLKNEVKILSTKSLRDFEDILPNDIFYRVHNSHIVNINFIKKYHKGRGGYIELEDGTTLEVATRRKNDFLSKFE
jgi:two-component system, LytTR family, response regulator